MTMSISVAKHFRLWNSFPVIAYGMEWLLGAQKSGTRAIWFVRSCKCQRVSFCSMCSPPSNLISIIRDRLLSTADSSWSMFCCQIKWILWRTQFNHFNPKIWNWFFHFTFQTRKNEVFTLEIKNIVHTHVCAPHIHGHQPENDIND